jgi:hypothetical protein
VIIIIVQNLDKKLANKEVKPKNESGKTKKREQLEFNLIEKEFRTRYKCYKHEK